MARWRREPQRQLDASNAQLLVALLIASFPGHYVSVDSEDVIRRRFIGRHQRDVLEAIEALALEADKVSVRRLIELCDERRRIRAEAEAAAEEARRPKPPPAPPSWRARLVMEAEIIKAIVRCAKARNGWGISDESLDVVVGKLRRTGGSELAALALAWRAREARLSPGPLAGLVDAEKRATEDPEVWARYYEALEQIRRGRSNRTR